MSQSGTGYLGTVIVSILASLILAYLAATYAPAVLDDLALAKGAPASNGMPIAAAHCRTFNRALSFCGISVKTGPQTEAEYSYLFMGRPRGDDKVFALTDPARPGLVTTNVGLAHATNRALTLAALVITLVIGTIIMWLRAVLANRDRAW